MRMIIGVQESHGESWEQSSQGALGMPSSSETLCVLWSGRWPAFLNPLMTWLFHTGQSVKEKLKGGFGLAVR